MKNKKPEWIRFGSSGAGRNQWYVSDAGMIRIIDQFGNVKKEYKGYLNKRTGYYHFGGTYVHRIVAKAFLPEPVAFGSGIIEVDHISGDKSDNSVGNIRWVTRKVNANGAHRRQMASLHYHNTKHPHECIEGTHWVNGVKEIVYFKNGMRAAKHIGCSAPLVYNAIKGARGEHWA